MSIGSKSYTNASKPAGKLGRLTGTAGRFMFLALAVLVLLELGARLVFPDRHSFVRLFESVEDARGYVIAPGRSVTFGGLSARLPKPVNFDINAQGLREDRTVSAKPGADRFRVASFGDSEVFGWSVDLEQTFQRRMEELSPGLEAVNFGVPGYNAVNVAAQFKIMSERFEFPVAVYLFNSNDFDPDIPKISFTPFAGLPSKFLRMIIVSYLKHEQKKWKNPKNSPDKRKAIKALRDVANICSKKGIRLLLVFTSRQDRSVFENDPVLMKYFSDGGKGEILDATQVFNNSPRLDGHLGPAGHRELAAFLVSAVETWRSANN